MVLRWCSYIDQSTTTSSGLVGTKPRRHTYYSEYLLNFRIFVFRSLDHLGSFRMICHEFLHCLRVFVRAIAQNLLLWTLMPTLVAWGLFISSIIGVTAKSKNRKDHPYERSRSISHNPSSYCHHTISSSYRLHAIFNAQKWQGSQKLQPCDFVTQFLTSTLSNHSIEFLFRCFRDSILYNDTTC